MPRLRRRMLLLCPWALPARAEDAGRPALEDGFTLDALMARMQAAGPRRARFVETRRFAALEGALESRGWLSFEAGRLVKVTEWPQPERLEVDGSRIVITAGNEPPRVIDMGVAPGLGVLIDAIRGPLAGDAAALRRGFLPSLSGGFGGWRLTLAPRTPGLLRQVRLAGAGAFVAGIEVVQANGDEQDMVLSAFE